MVIFVTGDETGRSIRLTDERWKHIIEEHPDVAIEEIKATVKAPTKITPSSYNTENVCYYSKVHK